MTYEFEVKGMTGDTLCHITTSTHDAYGRDLKVSVANKLGICECRLDLVAGPHRIAMGTPMVKILRWVKPGNTMYAIRKNSDAGGINAKDMIEKGYCSMCMRKAGVGAYELLAVSNDIDVVGLRNAGYSLSELVTARDRIPRFFFQDPPKTKSTMFDSQLKEAGYTAKDFRDAGFSAVCLSLNYVRKNWQDWGEKDVVETFAFFTATELREAKYSAEELRRAEFSDAELAEAGYVVPPKAIPAKAMPLTKRKIIAAKSMPAGKRQKKPE